VDDRDDEECVRRLEVSEGVAMGENPEHMVDSVLKVKRMEVKLIIVDVLERRNLIVKLVFILKVGSLFL
jgi:hypothetical protein